MFWKRLFAELNNLRKATKISVTGLKRVRRRRFPRLLSQPRLLRETRHHRSDIVVTAPDETTQIQPSKVKSVRLSTEWSLAMTTNTRKIGRPSNPTPRRP